VKVESKGKNLLVTVTVNVTCCVLVGPHVIRPFVSIFELGEPVRVGARPKLSWLAGMLGFTTETGIPIWYPTGTFVSAMRLI
jgi:hypothetical protein